MNKEAHLCPQSCITIEMIDLGPGTFFLDTLEIVET